MRPRTLLLAGAWLALLALSRALEPRPPAPRPDAGAGRLGVEVAPQGDDGPLEGGQAELSLLHWPAAAGAPPGPPLVCLHGSPGSARNFERLGPLLAAQGRDVWALDLPGFGRSRGPVGGHSILAHARSLLAVLERLGVERAHLLGWSMGGGVALHAADLDPDRVASLSLVASVGVQEAEGSGSYVLEHAKILLLGALLVGLDRLVPHFGALSPLRREGRAFVLNFWESDQRPLRGILTRLEAPTLILHGREDVLVPVRAAEISHELVPASRLVVLDANHFLPLAQADEVAAQVLPFLQRHDVPGLAEPRARVEQRPASPWRRHEPGVLALGHALPWWLQLAGLAAAGAAAPFVAAAFGGSLVAAAQLDLGLVAIALALGALARAVRAPRRRARNLLVGPLKAWGWLLLALLAALLLAPLAPTSAPRWLAPLVALVLLLAGGRWLRGRRPRPSIGGDERVG